MTEQATPVLAIDDLRVSYRTPHGDVFPVRGVSLSIAPGETVGVVGESGSGKSVFARSAMGLSFTDPTADVAGSVRLNGTELTALDRSELRKYWGSEVAMVFQDPLASLNPVRTIGSHFVVPLREHLGLRRRDALARAEELLGAVGIPEPAKRLKQYPHELSGGMRQRVMIALAIAADPAVVLADEPTTALDVTVQRQVLDLLERLANERHMGLLFITHDLSLVAGRADRIMVMYAGNAVELAPAAAVFQAPRHHYTAALLDSVPTLDGPRQSRLRSIPGTPPDLRVVSDGCSFRDRCPAASERCATERPQLQDLGDGVSVACHHPLEHTPSSATSRSAS